MEIEEMYLSSAQTTRLYGVTKQGLAKWVQRGFPKAKRDTYPLFQGHDWWSSHVNADELDEMRIAKLKREQAKARTAEMEAEHMAGNLVPKGAASDWLTLHISNARAAMLGWPRKVAEGAVNKVLLRAMETIREKMPDAQATIEPCLSGISGTCQKEIQLDIQAEVHGVLEGLSKANGKGRRK